MDRLGSVRVRGGVELDYYPYGEEKPGATTQGHYKFGTYMRDADGLDYARQRYYSSQIGRFLSADFSGLNEAVGNPLSWNRYAYVEGDPVNHMDPSGLSSVEVPPVVIVNPPNCSSYLIPGIYGLGLTLHTFLNSPAGMLGITTFFEQEGTSPAHENTWIAMGWTIVNRYKDEKFRPRPSSLEDAIVRASNLWDNSTGKLLEEKQTDLIGILGGPRNHEDCEGLLRSFAVGTRVINTAIYGGIWIPGAIPAPNPIGDAVYFLFGEKDPGDYFGTSIYTFPEVTPSTTVVDGWHFYREEPVKRKNATVVGRGGGTRSGTAGRGR